jgi:phytoene dehydrogenase-like protein
MSDLDAVVVGSGPNGLAAAIALAQSGVKVRVLEADRQVGGGLRSSEATLPGFIHDHCSAIHPLGVGSPFFRTLPLENFGLEWVHAPAPLAHPLDDGTAVLLERSILGTVHSFDGGDAGAYRAMMHPLVEGWESLSRILLAPIAPLRHPLGLMRFGINALRPISGISRRFRGARACALLAGMAGHGMLPLDVSGSGAIALVLAAAGHSVGWPFPRGGAQKLADALAAYLRSLGGEIVTDTRVRSMADVPSCRAVLFDLSPRPLLEIIGEEFPPRYRKLLTQFRYSRMGAFKVDWALSAPVPWRTRDVQRAATVHLGGTLEEISAAERSVWVGRPARRPYMILAQHTLFDHMRAPEGKHTLWGYCHVPFGSEHDMLPAMEAQIERFAPGFRDCVLARKVTTPRDFEAFNPNLVGGDITGGMQDLWQSVIRPTLNHYATPLRNVFICSASTPPGGGVHGMCGFAAAKVALRRIFRA